MIPESAAQAWRSSEAMPRHEARNLFLAGAIGFASFLLSVCPLWAHPRESIIVQHGVKMFVLNRSVLAWDHAVLAARSGPRDTDVTVYSLVVDFYIAVAERDSPGSLVPPVVTPPGKDASPDKRLRSLVDELRRRDSPELWEVLRVMATQTTEENLVRTASELAWRLSPSRCQALAKEVASLTPTNTDLFVASYRRFEAAAGKPKPTPASASLGKAAKPGP